MPIYTYRCTAGHTFDALVKLDKSDAPTTCPELDRELTARLHVETACGRAVEQQLAVNAKLFPGADSWRK